MTKQIPSKNRNKCAGFVDCITLSQECTPSRFGSGFSIQDEPLLPMPRYPVYSIDQQGHERNQPGVAWYREVLVPVPDNRKIPGTDRVLCCGMRINIMEPDIPGQWVREVQAGITVCDRFGTVLEMNDASAAAYAADGGYDLIGKNVRDCHPPGALNILEGMLKNGTPHIYIVEKNGARKMVCQLPWYTDGTIAGLVELSINLPETVPVYRRGP